MKKLNEQLLATPSDRASTVSLTLMNEKEIIESDSVLFESHSIESNSFEEVSKKSFLSGYKALDGIQQQCWRALSVFPYKFDSAAAAALWGMKLKQEAETLLKALEAQELVVCLPQAGDSARYTLDNSARLFASARLSVDEHQEALYRHAKHYKEVLQQAALLYEQGGEGLERGLALFEQEWPNIQAGQLWSSDSITKNHRRATLCRDYQEVGGYMLLVGLDSEEWLAWQKAAIMAAEYLHSFQNEQEIGGYEQQRLNFDGGEGEEGQPLEQNSYIEELQAKALRLADEGALYVEEGLLELGVERLHEQLKIVRRFDDEAWEAKTLYKLANAYYLLEEIELSIEFYQESHLKMRNISSLQGEICTLLGLGRAYAELEELDYAIGFYECCLQLLEANQIIEPRTEAYLLEELGNAYELLGDLPRAIAFYERQLASASELGENKELSRALGYLGKVSQKSGQPKRAIDYYKQKIAIEQKGGNQSVEAETLGLLGAAYAELEEYQPAIAYYQQQLSLVRELGNPELEESALWGLALAYHKAEQISEAIEYYEQQLAIVRQLGKQKEETLTLEYLGLAYHKLGEVKQAIVCHQQQLILAQQLENWPSKGRALEYLGLTYAELNQLPEAIKSFEQQLAIASMFRSRQREAQALAHLANAYDLQGDSSNAIKFYHEALQFNRELKDEQEEANNLWYISLVFSQQGKIEQAIKYAQASLAIYEQLKSSAMRVGDTALGLQATKIRQELNKWQQKGTLGTVVQLFNKAFRTSLFPAT